jgi:antitoxin component YwqK of YwqJK toxin-antitoxin module
MQKNVLYGFVLLLFVISCNDKDSPIEPKNEPAKKCRLVKMIQGTHNGAVNDTTFNFYYNAAGKLNMVTDYYSGYPGIDSLSLTYNDSGKLVKIMHSKYFNPNGTTFTYTSFGLLSEVNYRSLASFDYMKMRFVYNGSSTLPDKAVVLTLTAFGGPAKDSSEYRYTAQNGSIVSKEKFNSKGASSGKTTFAYDTIPNLSTDVALIGLFDEPIGFADEVLYFSKNTIKTYSSPGYSYNVNYKLDSGKIVQSLTYYDQAPQPGATRNYFWECN